MDDVGIWFWRSGTFLLIVYLHRHKNNSTYIPVFPNAQEAFIIDWWYNDHASLFRRLPEKKLQLYIMY